MAHKCFISFKKEDEYYKILIQQHKDIDMIDKSLDDAIDSDDEDYIMRKIREDYLSDSTVTIHLIGTRSAENLGWDEQRFIKRELRASLYHGESNSQSGILGIVLPEMNQQVYGSQFTCQNCGGVHHGVYINDNSCVKEFSYNFYIPEAGRCSWPDDKRYCILANWADFYADPNKYIDLAFAKRTEPIAEKIKVRP